jgi:hypothetical protein
MSGVGAEQPTAIGRAAIGGPGENAPKWCREVPAETEAAARIGGEFHLRRKKIGCCAKFFFSPCLALWELFTKSALKDIFQNIVSNSAPYRFKRTV